MFICSLHAKSLSWELVQVLLAINTPVSSYVHFFAMSGKQFPCNHSQPLILTNHSMSSSTVIPNPLEEW